MSSSAAVFYSNIMGGAKAAVPVEGVDLENSSQHSRFSTSTQGTGQTVPAVAKEFGSLDFDEMEGIMWRKHHFRRFFQDRGIWFTAERRTTTWRWALIIVTGILVALMGACVQQMTMIMMNFKFSTSQMFLSAGDQTKAYFSFVSISVLYSLLAGLLCWFEPAAAGSGIPEIKAYLNGVNLNNVVRLRVLFSKVLGMCLSVSSGLPLGKEGPMIHAGNHSLSCSITITTTPYCSIYHHYHIP